MYWLVGYFKALNRTRVVPISKQKCIYFLCERSRQKLIYCRLFVLWSGTSWVRHVGLFDAGSNGADCLQRLVDAVYQPCRYLARLQHVLSECLMIRPLKERSRHPSPIISSHRTSFHLSISVQFRWEEVTWDELSWKRFQLNCSAAGRRDPAFNSGVRSEMVIGQLFTTQSNPVQPNSTHHMKTFCRYDSRKTTRLIRT